MRNLPFVIWMVGYSFNMSWDLHWFRQTNIEPSIYTLIFCLLLWAGIGILLFESKGKE